MKSKAIYNFSKKYIHNIGEKMRMNKESFDAYSAHSPLNLSRGRAEELRTKIFYDTPQVPNRVPKYFFLFTVVMTTWLAAVEKSGKRNKLFLREEEKKLMSAIIPFNQAMEDLRFTALEQKQYMINKSMADQYSPGFFEKIRQRFNQEDIYVDLLRKSTRNSGAGSYGLNSTALSGSIYISRTMSDKGLFDNREVGYND